MTSEEDAMSAVIKEALNPNPAHANYFTVTCSNGESLNIRCCSKLGRLPHYGSTSAKTIEIASCVKLGNKVNYSEIRPPYIAAGFRKSLRKTKTQGVRVLSPLRRFERRPIRSKMVIASIMKCY
jgi:hypothetical protein